MPGLGPSAPGKPSRPGKPTLTLGIPPDCPALDCEPAVALDEPASPLAPAGIPALDGEPADELEAELDDDDGIDGLLLELLELLGGDGLLGELLDALEGLLGEGIDDDDELWLCD
ncbi:MAG: hypothetical protein HN740_07915 [Gammaproteobacteria bacterium]|nr:hypothetical protein [Gammaproteobacteria bacterium]MBT4781649.1 hypothetical protein [Gammaproteobacteria bacterium]MBT5906959.1 hypothetical protein [Gammaproteobacteria bacterium]MBT7764758.1 hypothetical protein [Gammaproteobacteria bacterium]